LAALSGGSLNDRSVFAHKHTTAIHACHWV
jgi:hypothetical protein